MEVEDCRDAGGCEYEGHVAGVMDEEMGGQKSRER